MLFGVTVPLYFFTAHAFRFDTRGRRGRRPLQLRNLRGFSPSPLPHSVSSSRRVGHGLPAACRCAAAAGWGRSGSLFRQVGDGLRTSRGITCRYAVLSGVTVPLYSFTAPAFRFDTWGRRGRRPLQLRNLRGFSPSPLPHSVSSSRRVGHGLPAACRCAAAAGWGRSGSLFRQVGDGLRTSRGITCRYAVLSGVTVPLYSFTAPAFRFDTWGRRGRRPLQLRVFGKLYSFTAAAFCFGSVGDLNLKSALRSRH